MTASWGILDTAWGSFENYWNSNASAAFKLGLFVWIAVIFVNLIVYVRARLERNRAEVSRGRILGRVMAVVGGLITLIGILMPWVRVDAGIPSYYRLWFPGDVAWLVFVLGLLWFAFFAVPKEVAAILGAFWGSLALVLTILALKRISDLAAVDGGVYVEYGLGVSMLGSFVLIVGSVLAFVKANQTKRSEPISSDVAAPPVP